jgi:hypothetical protein
MKKTVSLLTGFLFLVFILHAQKKQPKFLVELGVGPSFPIGKFADKEVTDLFDKNPSSLAKTGMAANIMVGYYLKESVGLLLTAGYSANKQDGAGYEEYYSKSWYPNASRLDVSTNSWKILKVMGGGFLVTPLTSENELSLLTKLSAGICKTAVPKYSYSAYGQNGSWMAMGTQGKITLPMAFCYQISVGLQYKLNDKLHLLLDINSFNATAKREFTYTILGNPTPGNPDQRITQVNKYKLAQVNVLAGIGLNF